MYTNLEFIGIGSALNPVMGNTAAWFVMDGKLAEKSGILRSS